MPEKVAIVITAFMRPYRLKNLLANISWAGWPDIPTYVIVDAPVTGWKMHPEIMTLFIEATRDKRISQLLFRPDWGCMQGSIETAMAFSEEDWIIYIPDDVLFTKGGLYNELAGCLAYGRPWIGCIQAPYWNADDLSNLGVIGAKVNVWESWRGWIGKIPHNPHWDHDGLPRSYVNVNGAGFTISRNLWKDMGGFPKKSWRLDEYAGFQAWKSGRTCITLPGPPRIHYFGASTPDIPDGGDFHTKEKWEEEVGLSVNAAATFCRNTMKGWGGDGISYDRLVEISKERKCLQA